MRRIPLTLVAGTLLLTILASACGGSPAQPATSNTPAPSAPPPTAPPPTAPPPTAPPPTAQAAAGGEAAANEIEDFDPNNFDAGSANIDNPWMPLQPGTQFIYQGAAMENEELVPHRIVFTVTDLTKVLNGVRNVVVFDRDYSNDKLVEAELTFFAQDKAGNVWHFGQYREIYDDVELVGGRVWLEGYLDGAHAGIMMQADPQPDTPSYSQGFAPPPFHWTDRARVYQMGQKTTVPFGSYTDVLVTEEYNNEEPNAFQLKYYARGVGNVRVGWRGDDANQEDLELIDVVQLDPAALAKVREEALALEQRAYIYSRTPPAEPIPPAQ